MLDKKGIREMTTIKNPIIPGMAPDPSIIRVNEIYYIATSTFHWNPGIQIFKSTDLAKWELISYGLKTVKLIYVVQIHQLVSGHHIYPLTPQLIDTG
ncbi:family 43 glycosylhydrolase [Priestia megaterium]